MPVDRNGNKIHVDDLVNIPCRITGIDKHKDGINLSVEPVFPLTPGWPKTMLLMNCDQVELYQSVGKSADDIDVVRAIKDSKASEEKDDMA